MTGGREDGLRTCATRAHSTCEVMSQDGMKGAKRSQTKDAFQIPVVPARFGLRR